MPKVPKIRSFHIFAISPEKAWVMKLILPADINIFTLGVRSQACPKYPKQEVYNSSALSQRKREGLS